ncbi:MAG TPA: carboxypeptidase-like regulatory domain-containing protein [Candidatus Norongarragalinales archaeon]|nr:carboxypeptidase-like regulatory domain-containing protein [Candidatus Norongarragalinales archaeon]
MKLFFRALFLGVLGLGAFFVSIFWLPSVYSVGKSFVAGYAFLFLLGLLFGSAVLFQAREDFEGYKKLERKTSSPLIKALVILLVMAVLAYAGFQYWKASQPVTVTLTYVDASTQKPLADASLYLYSGYSPYDQVRPDRVLLTDQYGQATTQLARQKGWDVFGIRYVSGTIQPSLLHISTWDFTGDQLDFLVSNQSQYSVVYGASLRLLVLDESGNPIVGAFLDYYADAGLSETLETDASGDGEFFVQGHAGPYDVVVRKDGYLTQVAHASTGLGLNVVVLAAADFVPIG